MAVEQSAGADVVEALLVAGANYDVTEKVRAANLVIYSSLLTMQVAKTINKRVNNLKQRDNDLCYRLVSLW